MKKVVIVFIILIFFFFTILFIGNTLAYRENNITDEIYYSPDTELLEQELYTYISKIDDILIPTSSFNYSNILTENYDFLVDFALRYIYENKAQYQDKIITIKNSGLEENEYVDISLVYDITSKYFNKRDFYIINKNVNIEGNLISLLSKYENNFNFSLISINNININNNTLSVDASYPNNTIYKYTFKVLEDNRIVIENIEL